MCSNVLNCVGFLGPSASESAQPLSQNLDLAMESLLHGSTKIRSPHDDNREKSRMCDIHLRKTALQVIGSLNQQGLINPTKILPTIFTLMFYDDRSMQDMGTKMIKDMVELRPQQLLNRFEESVHRSFSLFLDLDRESDLVLLGRLLFPSDPVDRAWPFWCCASSFSCLDSFFSLRLFLTPVSTAWFFVPSCW